MATEKNQSIPFIAKDDRITFIHGNRSHTILSDEFSYNQVLSFLKAKDFDSIRKVLDGTLKEKALNSFIPESTGLTVKDDGTVFFKGEEIKNSVVNRIKTFIAQGLPFEPLVKFLENLLQNPSFNSRTQLYSFLEHNDIPITEDGFILSYKAVRADFYDKHSGTIKNDIGKTIKMDRSKIDDNPNNHCSSGLHVGAIEYVQNFFHSGQDKILICKVNPRDVVSVPNDHNARKVRVCEYTVVDFYTGPLTQHLYDDKIQRTESIYSTSYQDLKDEYDDWDEEDLDEDDDFEDELDDDDEDWDEELEDDEDTDCGFEDCDVCGPFDLDEYSSQDVKPPVLPQRDRYGRFIKK